ncbi:MAG: aminoacyl--tRNA ligase-related protein [Patescibacteria group bacterium]
MRQSLLFTKTRKDISKEDVSVNANLLTRGGFIDRLSAGVYTFLPLGLRVLNKIEQIVREEMDRVGGMEVLMPALQPKENWEATGRWSTFDVLFKIKDSNDKENALGATHEEVVTPLLQKFVHSYKDLPKAVYQIQTKFRNETRPKSGLLRGREFRMKDLYSFHANTVELDSYYEKVQEAYARIYLRCGMAGITYLTFASGGTFSKYSHEYQTITDAGEDIIYVCTKCNVAINREIMNDLDNQCVSCKSKDLQEKKAIEVGNIFKLGTKYSDAFGFEYVDENGQSRPVIMGCYGLGPTRIMGAIVETHSDAAGIVWPKSVAPMAVHLISLCRESADLDKAESVYQSLIGAGIDTLFDDRADARAGEKFADSDLIGIPLRVVISPKTLADGQVEVKKRADVETKRLSLTGIVAGLTKELEGVI